MMASNTELLKQIADLQKQVTKLSSTGGNRRNRNNNNNNNRSGPRNHDSYCWTHGFQVGRYHTSETCRTPAEGHKKEATKDNRLGGSEAGLVKKE